MPVDTPEENKVKLTRFDEDGNEIIEEDIVEEEEAVDTDMEITDEGEEDPDAEPKEPEMKTITQ